MKLSGPENGRGRRNELEREVEGAVEVKDEGKRRWSLAAGRRKEPWEERRVGGGHEIIFMATAPDVQ